MSRLPDDEVAPATGGWGVVVPVKRLDVAKSRLAVLGEPARRALALAFAKDVVVAALATPQVRRVLVVTDDRTAAPALLGLGAVVVPDEPDAGLNEALAHGAALLRKALPGCGVAAVSADLPALRAAELSALLTEVVGRGVVADAAESGTTVLAAAAGTALRPEFGPSSLSRHLASGAGLLRAGPGARRDVDTPLDLGAALALGVGTHTHSAWARLPADLRPPSEGSAAVGQGTMIP